MALSVPLSVTPLHKSQILHLWSLQLRLLPPFVSTTHWVSHAGRHPHVVVCVRDTDFLPSFMTVIIFTINWYVLTVNDMMV